MAAGDEQVAQTEAPDTESLEQQRAVALARARLRMQQTPQEESGTLKQLGRQVGLTARAAGPTAAGAAAGAALGAPTGVGAVAGAGAGALAMTIVSLVDKLGGTNYVDKLLDRMGLPKPENEQERIVGAATEGMTGAGAISAGAKALLPGIVGQGRKAVAETLAANPGLTGVSAASGGATQEIVKEAGGGPTEQFLGNLVWSAAAPGAVALGRGAVNAAGNVLGDMTHAVGAAMGRKASTERLAQDVIRNMGGVNTPEVRDALSNVTTHVPGTKPTVAEAIAEANLKDPSKQIGGAAVKLQDELTGAKGVEDLLPSALKGNQAAVAKYIEDLQATTAPMREAALGQARASHLLKRGVPVAKIQHDILMESLTPGNRANQTLRAVATDVGAQIKKQLTQHGTINPDDLYAIRMNVGNTLRKHFERSGGRWDAKMASGFERNVQRSIDDAIEASGATGWKSYLKAYSEGMSAVTRHEDRLKAVGDIAKGVGGQKVGAAVQEELPHIPTMLHRPTMFVNFVLKLIAKDATAPVTRELATRMQDPQQFLQLMARPDAAPAKKAMYDVMINAAILSNLIQRHQAGEASSPE